MELIKNNIFYCGVNDADRKLFDELIPLPQGTTYNSYLIKGSEKTALIDTSYSTKIEQYLKCVGDDVQIDYIIANHAEGDHTDALALMLKKHSGAVVFCTQKAKEIIIDARDIPQERFHVVTDGEELSLGDKTLKFLISPWVHWPDTMFTYVLEDKVLFTCDFLGAHISIENMECGIFAPETEEYLEGARRYYSEIMMPFRVQCKNYIEKIQNLEDGKGPDIICPSHGGVYKNPKFILDAYSNWTSDIPCNKVTLVYVSMYHNTENAISYLEKKLLAKGVLVDKYNLAKDDFGEYVCSLVDSATVILGASMVLAGPHPVAMNAAFLTNALRPNIKFMGIVGSYGWAGNLAGKLAENINLKLEMLEPVIFKGKAKPEDIKRLDALVESIVAKHKEIGVRTE